MIIIWATAAQNDVIRIFHFTLFEPFTIFENVELQKHAEIVEWNRLGRILVWEINLLSRPKE